MSDEFQSQIKAWAKKQDDQPALATAIRRLVELGLRDEVREGHHQAFAEHRAAARLAAKEAEMAKKRAAKKAKGK